jgi:large subunit ribosomal protein L19
MLQAIKEFEKERMKKDIPQFSVGDDVKVHMKIVMEESEKRQVFEGTVIAKKHGGLTETFTVRKISYGVAVERTFPLHSPLITKVEVVKKGNVRRAKLYYLRRNKIR